jgi:phosphatidylglycerol lysyltransferase
VGWTLDVMRRSRTAPPGTVEFLIATALGTFREEGAEFASLSGAPLALPPGTGDGSGLTRLLTAAGRLMEPVYGFRSLLAFKAKFQPEYRPLYLCYPDPAALPAIGLAIARAYLPEVTARQSARLLSRLR